MRTNTIIKFCVAAFFLGCASEARAGVTFNFYQSGSDVVAMGSGSLLLDALTLTSNGNAPAYVFPMLGRTLLGDTNNTFYAVYGSATGPASFGSGGALVANSGSGNRMGIFGDGGAFLLIVPSGYVSGTPLSSTSTWSGQTLASLGLVQGTYVYSWGADATYDSLTIIISEAQIPEPGTLGLAGVVLASLFLFRRRRSQR